MPIARWTIGDVYKDGFVCLKYSIKSFAKIYPEFKYVICYNSIDKSKLDYLKDLHLPLEFVEQKSCIFKGCEGIWKYTPPRLDISDREIFIDNDIIFFNRIEIIDAFLKRDLFFFCEDDIRFYGNFAKKISEAYNSGIFGIPEKFDFEAELKKINKYPNLMLNKADEQGLTIELLSSKYAFKISKKQIAILHPEGIAGEKKQFKPYFWDSLCGIHFVRLNLGPHAYFNYFRSNYKFL